MIFLFIFCQILKAFISARFKPKYVKQILIGLGAFNQWQQAAYDQ